MKRVWKLATITLMVSIVALLLSSCGGTKPKKVAEEAINEEIRVALSQEQDFSKFYSYLSSLDKEACTLDNFKTFYAIPVELKGALDLIPEAKDVIAVKDFKEQITGETALVTFKLILPDTDKMGNLSLSDLQSLAGEKWRSFTDLPEELQQKIKADVEKNGVPTKEHAINLDMVREGDAWMLDLHLPAQLKEGKKIKSVFHLVR